MVKKTAKGKGKIKRGEIEILLTSAHVGQFIMRNPKEIKKGESWEITAENVPKMEQVASFIAHNRGRILQHGISLENTLDIIIRTAIHGHKITTGSKLFEGLILKTNRLPLRSKFNIFKRLTKELGLLKNDDYSKLFDKIDKLINLRNKFAHGMLIFEGERVFLRHYQGRGKETELTEKYFKDKIMFFVKTLDELQEVSHILIQDGISKSTDD